MQKIIHRCLVVAFFAALTSGVFCLGKEDTVSPESLLAQARKSQDVWSAGTPAVKMQTAIEILDAKGKTIPGQYVVTWISPLRWREELEIANYRRLRVHDAKGYWQQSTLSVQPEIIFQLDSLLDFKKVLKLEAKEALGKVKIHDKDGVRQRCTGIKWKTISERILCFDEVSGNLLSVEYPKSERGNPPEISQAEYSSFKKVGDKRIPFETRGYRDRTAVVTAKVLDVTPINDEDAALFAKPPNSEFWAQCDDVQSPELLSKVQPDYPANARANREKGRVIFYAIIELDGTVSHLALIQRATSTLEASAATAIRQWHYKPATCDSTPIRVETSISVDFWVDR